MSLLAHKSQHVLNILRELPPAKVNEVIDFAEYLKSRTRKTEPRKRKATDLPLYHMGAVNLKAFDRTSLYGERLDSLLA
ncbi:MAG: hypothetical protein WCL71_01975 [Deltaproteobacteria bacterium]